MSRRKRLGEHFQVGEPIGKGEFSTVYTCLDQRNGAHCAVKVVAKRLLQHSELGAAFEREIDALIALRRSSSPHITNVIDILHSSRNLYIVMELASGGTLQRRVVKRPGGRGGLPLNLARRFIFQLVSGVADMHNCNVVHRDLKPDNILLDQFDNIRITDFGFAAVSPLDKLLYRECGTPQYVAPEVLLGKGYYGRLSDVWSVGVIVYFILFGVLPFDASTTQRVFDLVLKGEWSIPKHTTEIGILPLSAEDFIRSCLTLDPQMRSSAETLLRHPFLSSFDMRISNNQYRPVAEQNLHHLASNTNPYTSLGDTTSLLRSYPSVPSNASPLPHHTFSPRSGNPRNVSHSSPNLRELGQIRLSSAFQKELYNMTKRKWPVAFNSSERFSPNSLANAKKMLPCEMLTTVQGSSGSKGYQNNHANSTQDFTSSQSGDFSLKPNIGSNSMRFIDDSSPIDYSQPKSLRMGITTPTSCHPSVVDPDHSQQHKIDLKQEGSNYKRLASIPTVGSGTMREGEHDNSDQAVLSEATQRDETPNGYPHLIRFHSTRGISQQTPWLHNDSLSSPHVHNQVLTETPYSLINAPDNFRRSTTNSSNISHNIQTGDASIIPLARSFRRRSGRSEQVSHERLRAPLFYQFRLVHIRLVLQFFLYCWCVLILAMLRLFFDVQITQLPHFIRRYLDNLLGPNWDTEEVESSHED